jgi:hypothetical protein
MIVYYSFNILKGSMMGLSRKMAGIGANLTVLALSAARLGDGIGNDMLFFCYSFISGKTAIPLVPAPETVQRASIHRDQA